MRSHLRARLRGRFAEPLDGMYHRLDEHADDLGPRPTAVESPAREALTIAA